MTANPAQLFLLSDHIKLSLLERQRAISLNLVPNSQNAEISRSLESFQDGLEAVERQQSETTPTQQAKDQANQLRQQYNDLLSQFSSHPTTSSTTTAPTSPTLTRPNDASLSSTFSHAQKYPPTTPPPKSVRFTDAKPTSTAPHYDSAATAATPDPSRAALFPYRDDPSSSSPTLDDDNTPPDHAHLDNHQIHAYHTQVLADQDEQLDGLSASITRQRDLSIQIGDELDEQAQLLDDVDEGVDRHKSQLDRARERVGRLARKARDNLSMTVILILIVILVLLIAILKT